MATAPTAEFQQAGKPVAQPRYLVDVNGNPISSFGGGTQYTDGQSPPANPVGTSQVFDNSGTWVDVGADHPLPVSDSNTATIAINTTGVATAANQVTGNSSLSTIATNTTGLNSTKGTAIQASNTGAAGAATTATLAGVASKTTYITGFTVIAGNVAAVVSGLVTITGLATTLNYYLIESVTAGGVINVSFKEPVPASAQNTAIVVNVPAITSGGVISIAATGFQL